MTLLTSALVAISATAAQAGDAETVHTSNTSTSEHALEQASDDPQTESAREDQEAEFLDASASDGTLPTSRVP